MPETAPPELSRSSRPNAPCRSDPETRAGGRRPCWRGSNTPRRRSPAPSYLPGTGGLYRTSGNLDPAAPAMALELRVQNQHLPQPVRELRILRLRIRVFDRRVEAPENLLECVVVAFAVAARQIRIGSRAVLQQSGIFDDDLVGGIAPADPQLIGALLVPGHARLGAIEFDAQPVFTAGRDLARRKCAARAVAHAEQHSREIVGRNRGR